MSTPSSKNKEKRPRPSTEPPKSFVKNVTSRVSFLLPATITKWFSTPSTSNTNGSVPVADATDSSTEDEAPESPNTFQPPAKRRRYSSSGEFKQPPPVETKSTSTNTETIDEIYTVNSSIGRSNVQQDNIFMSTHVNANNDDIIDQPIQETSFFKSQHSLSPIDQPKGKKRKFLFDIPQDDSIKQNTYSYSGNVRDPYFKPSLLSSPFYVGRTMYGGASASYLTSPCIKERKINVTNDSSNNETVNMSHSARRVMDLLEHYSSPLIDAKRIPQITRDPEKCTHNTSQQSVNSYGPNNSSYKTRELYVPNNANIITIKRKNRLMDTTSAARQIIASHSSTAEVLPYPKTKPASDMSDSVSGDKLTTKVKSTVTRTNREKDIEIESDIPETVCLPNVVLQIDKDNLPKFFTFGTTSTSQPSQSSSIQTPVIITPEALKRTTDSAIAPDVTKQSSECDKADFSKLKDVDKDKPVQVKDNENYAFSRPIQVSSESPSTTTPPPIFSYGSPERNIEKVEKVEEKDNPLILNDSNKAISDNKLPLPSSTDWKCLDCWFTNKAGVNKCVCCGGNKPVEIDNDGSKKCSVCNIANTQAQCDKCTECDKKTTKFDKPLLINETNVKKWSFNDSWVQNKKSADEENCKKVIPTESDWRCNDCWVQNKATLTKCACCGGSQPGTQTNGCKIVNNPMPKDSQSDEKVKEKSDTTFKNIAMAQNEKWECALCLVRNESTRLTCICCEASKPGTEKQVDNKFNFHQPTEITFKFGIQPMVQETSTNIEPEECNMGEESETNNNIFSKTPYFSFKLPAKKSEEVPELPVDKLAQAPKLNFSFGVPKDISMSSVPNTIFGIPNKLIETSKNAEEKPQEVPQVITSPKIDEPLNKSQGLFSIPVTTQGPPAMPALVPLHQINQPSTAKKDTPFLSIVSTNSETKTQQNNFTFPSIMPTTNLFVTTPSTTTSTVLPVTSCVLPAPLSLSIPTTLQFLTPKVVTTTSASFFQKTEPLGASMFLKNDTKTTASTVSMGTMQPVFSFGGQGTVPQAEKPKFNFNFTNNNTENSTIFKPTFGVTTDNNISTNKFNLPSNSIVGGNALSGNSLNTTTQMNTNNTLTTGNTLTTPSTSNIFGPTVQKENMWSPNTNNIFATNTNTTANEAQKPPTFTFGTATPFTANNSAFGSTTQPQPAQPAQNIFGIANSTTTSQPPMFGNPLQSQSTPNIFGVQNNPMPMGIFGAPNPVVAPNFGAMNPPIPTFETSTLPPAPAPASFNFGGQPSIFGFGQQQPGQAPQQPENQAGMYTFGAPNAPGPQMQFNIGSAPTANTAGRRVRKAMRRTQR